MTVEEKAAERYPYISEHIPERVRTLALRQAYILGIRDANKQEDKPVTNEYLKQNGFHLVDMMFDNVPMRYYRNGKLIVERTEEGWIMRLWNDKEQEVTANLSVIRDLEVFARIIGQPFPNTLTI